MKYRQSLSADGWCWRKLQQADFIAQHQHSSKSTTSSKPVFDWYLFTTLRGIFFIQDDQLMNTVMHFAIWKTSHSLIFHCMVSRNSFNQRRWQNQYAISLFQRFTRRSSKTSSFAMNYPTSKERTLMDGEELVSTTVEQLAEDRWRNAMLDRDESLIPFAGKSGDAIEEWWHMANR